MSRDIRLPTRSLVVLCGPAGSGKSTFASQHFKQTQVVSSDACRALICDSESNRKINRDTFDLFHFIIQKRLKLDRLTVADSTALYAFARQPLLELARAAGYHACLIVFNVSLEVCQKQDQQRPRQVGAEAVFYQYMLLPEVLRQIHSEPWEQVHVLNEMPAEMRFTRQARSPP